MRNKKQFNPTIAVEEITPQLAAEYLKHNVINRPLRKKLIATYASYMAEGKWRVNIAEPITFADTGELVDGQHRLEAVIKSNMTVKMAVVRGADKADFVIVNTGAARSSGDAFSIAGIENSSRAAACVKIYFRLKNKWSVHDNGRNKYFNNEDLLNEYNTTPDLYQEYQNFGKKLADKSPISIFGAEVGGMVVYLIKDKGYTSDFVKAFFSYLVRGGESCRAITDLREKLQRDHISYKDMRMSALTRTKYIAKAWNLYSQHKDNTRLAALTDQDKVEFL